MGWSVTAKDGPTPAQPQTRPAAVGSVRAASTRRSCRRAASPSSLYTKSLTWADLKVSLRLSCCGSASSWICGFIIKYGEFGLSCL